MVVLTMVYDAKCKHCKFHISYKKGKLKRHFCTNKESINSGKDTALKQPSCEKFEL